MNCIDIQRLIMPFINDELDLGQLDEFVHHVHTCPNCMEELEVHYVLLSGMKQLDADREITNNFHQDLLDLLRLSEERIIHDKFLHIRKRIILIILISLVAITSSIRIGEFVVEDVLKFGPKESNYLMEDIFLVDPPADFVMKHTKTYKNSLSGKILNHLPEIYVYLRLNDLDSAEHMKEIFGKRIWKGADIPSGIGQHFMIPDWIIGIY